MDVARTMEFILERPAKAEQSAAKAEQSEAKADQRMAKSDERMDKFDKRLEATRKLVEAGIKIVLQTGEDIRGLAVQGNAFTEAQSKSDRKIERLMDSWAKQRSNGHQRRR